jgi:hypothetical protein
LPDLGDVTICHPAFGRCHTFWHEVASVDLFVDALLGYRGALIVVSHDDAFLARCT